MNLGGKESEEGNEGAPGGLDELQALQERLGELEDARLAALVKEGVRTIVP